MDQLPTSKDLDRIDEGYIDDDDEWATDFDDQEEVEDDSDLDAYAGASKPGSF